MLIRDNEGLLLMIERKKYNPGYALPAGHQDGDDPLATATKETQEEVGLTINKLEEKITKLLQNPCKREGGTHHIWKIFEVSEWSGEIKTSPDEVKTYVWADQKTIAKWAELLKQFADLKQISLEEETLPELVRATNEDPAWLANLGLEPPMYFLFKKLEII